MGSEKSGMDRGLNECLQEKERILGRLFRIHGTIRSVRMYLKNIQAKKRFSCETWMNRQDVIAAISTDMYTGFAECLLSVNLPDADLNEFARPCRNLIGMSVGDAFQFLRRNQGKWNERLFEMTEMALLDLAGKTEEVPANDLLDLNTVSPISGVHVILSDLPDEVSKSTAWTKENGKAFFIKVKLFGNEKVDLSVIRAVRKQCPEDTTFLIGDVNCGYRPHGSTIPEEDAVPCIAAHLKVLKEAGLNACEDPADLSVDGWVKLQEATGNLILIPDEPLRCSRKSLYSIRRGMGAVYNIHPDSAGSLIDAVILAQRIRQLGAGIMIGDDSLVGPSCSIWQQTAAGLQAEWVEATEKRKESDFYCRCVRSLATDSSVNPIQIRLQPGYGIDIDEELLLQECTRYVFS
ncbi:MAG: hypothetical protein ACOX78_08785 [Lachnospiraceae bacterium]|jgi:L-alanine-DL-glutamate epimerase-like enolase superfamily enzyme